MSHTLTVLSSEAETTDRPSGVTATDVTAAACPFREIPMALRTTKSAEDALAADIVESII
jgi:hypothetical protein